MNGLPDGACKYAETPIFTQATMPAKLTSMHDTKPGVWGKLVVLAGQLEYIVEGGKLPLQLKTAGEYTIIEPMVRHKVSLDKGAAFKIEFYRVDEQN